MQFGKFFVNSCSITSPIIAPIGFGFAICMGGCGRPDLSERPLVVPSPTPEAETAASFARIQKEEGVWKLVKDRTTLTGLGVNVVQPEEKAPRDPAKAYNGLDAHGGNLTIWANATAERLSDWGFDTVGAWSHEAVNQAGLPYTRVVWLGGSSGHGQQDDMRLVDVFDPAYTELIAQQAIEEVLPHAEDTDLIGFFINNELPFYGEFGWPTDPDKSLWDRYMALPKGSPGRIEAGAFFRSYYGDLDRARLDWQIEDFAQLDNGPPPTARSLGAQRFKHEWAGHVADRYYAVCSSEIRRHAPNHLILGSRHAGRPIAAVVRAEAKYTDVITINHYRPDGRPDLAMLRNLHALTGRPILITEFSWRAQENRSGNSNAKGAEVTVGTQADRARAYRSYVTEWMREPYALGAHWFQYHDQPSDGRSFDGENSNYGIVDVTDQPYEELVEAMRETNLAIANSLEARASPEQAHRFDAESWGEFMPVRLDGGGLDAPFNINFQAVTNLVKSDTGNSAAVETNEKGALVLTYQTGPGWGLHSNTLLPKIPAGARKMILRLRGQEGHRYRIFLSEDGDGPPGQQTYAGRDAADGESFEFPPFTASGQIQEIVTPLEDATIRQYWGNQRGDRKLATGGLGTFSLFVFPGQGDGEIVIESVQFSP